ncbi:MAG: hypothetical protein E7653_04715 [Ruminococcaceae bacterium]|nr:hypothetical protein [Oscillospiraceae bacterium]
MKLYTSVKGAPIKLLLAGLFAGAVNGLLGAGGGIITVFALTKIYKEKMSEKNDVFAHALCVMLPLSLLSCILYLSKGNFSAEGFGVFVLPAVLGGAVGGLLLDKLKAVFLRRLFASLVIISGILLIVR